MSNEIQINDLTQQIESIIKKEILAFKKDLDLEFEKKREENQYSDRIEVLTQDKINLSQQIQTLTQEKSLLSNQLQNLSHSRSQLYLQIQLLTEEKQQISTQFQIISLEKQQLNTQVQMISSYLPSKTNQIHQLLSNLEALLPTSQSFLFKNFLKFPNDRISFSQLTSRLQAFSYSTGSITEKINASLIRDIFKTQKPEEILNWMDQCLNLMIDLYNEINLDTHLERLNKNLNYYIEDEMIAIFNMGNPMRVLFSGIKMRSGKIILKSMIEE